MYMDIHPIKHHFGLPVFAQHIDPVTPGAHTGRIPLTAVKTAGAIGSLVNHSEYRLSIADIETNVQALRKEGMISCVCSNTVATTSAVVITSYSIHYTKLYDCKLCAYLSRASSPSFRQVISVSTARTTSEPWYGINVAWTMTSSMVLSHLTNLTSYGGTVSPLNLRTIFSFTIL